MKLLEAVFGHTSAANQIGQYLEVMKALLQRILEDIRKFDIDETKKGELKAKIREVLNRRTDYSNPKNIVATMRSLNLPSQYIESYSMFTERIAGVEDSWFEKILKSLKVDKESFKKYSGRIAIGAILAGVSALFIIKVVKNMKIDKYAGQIITKDINPVVFDIADLIIDKRITSEVKIVEILSDTEQAVLKQYNIA